MDQTPRQVTIAQLASAVRTKHAGEFDSKLSDNALVQSYFTKYPQAKKVVSITPKASASVTSNDWTGGSSTFKNTTKPSPNTQSFSQAAQEGEKVSKAKQVLQTETKNNDKYSGFFGRLGESVGAPLIPQAIQVAKQNYENIHNDGVKGILENLNYDSNVGSNIIEGLAGMQNYAPTEARYELAKDAFKQGNTKEALKQVGLSFGDAIGSIPLIGPIGHQIGEDLSEGRYSSVAGDAVGIAGQILLAHGLKPTSPTEITDAIPGTGMSEDTIKDLQQGRELNLSNGKVKLKATPPTLGESSGASVVGKLEPFIMNLPNAAKRTLKLYSERVAATRDNFSAIATKLFLDANSAESWESKVRDSIHSIRTNIQNIDDQRSALVKAKSLSAIDAGIDNTDDVSTGNLLKGVLKDNKDTALKVANMDYADVLAPEKDNKVDPSTSSSLEREGEKSDLSWPKQILKEYSYLKSKKVGFNNVRTDYMRQLASQGRISKILSKAKSVAKDNKITIDNFFEKVGPSVAQDIINKVFEKHPQTVGLTNSNRMALSSFLFDKSKTIRVSAARMYKLTNDMIRDNIADPDEWDNVTAQHKAIGDYFRDSSMLKALLTSGSSKIPSEKVTSFILDPSRSIEDTTKFAHTVFDSSEQGKIAYKTFKGNLIQNLFKTYKTPDEMLRVFDDSKNLKTLLKPEDYKNLHGVLQDSLISYKKSPEGKYLQYLDKLMPNIEENPQEQFSKLVDDPSAADRLASIIVDPKDKTNIGYGLFRTLLNRAAKNEDGAVKDFFNPKTIVNYKELSNLFDNPTHVSVLSKFMPPENIKALQEYTNDLHELSSPSKSTGMFGIGSYRIMAYGGEFATAMFVGHFNPILGLSTLTGLILTPELYMRLITNPKFVNAFHEGILNHFDVKSKFNLSILTMGAAKQLGVTLQPINKSPQQNTNERMF